MIVGSFFFVLGGCEDVGGRGVWSVDVADDALVQKDVISLVC